MIFDFGMRAFLALTLVYSSVACRTSDGSLPSGSGLQTAGKNGVPLDIPEDSELMTNVARGKIPPEYAANPEMLHEKLMDLFRKKFDEPVDQFGHRPNTVKLTGRMAEALGFPDVPAFAAAFENGGFKNIKLYTNENVDPLSNKGDKVPNYQVMNRALRAFSSFEELRQKDPRAAQLIADFESSFQQLPSARGVLYRGTGMKKALLEKVLKTRVMEDAGYTSTSIDVVDAFDFLRKQPNSAERQRVFMVIFGRSGKFIPFGEFAKEEEVLFPHGTKFKVSFDFRHADEEGSDLDTHYLFLEEIQ